ncbi:MAG: peptide deformylase [Patescibacteria group bacterium]|nr:peptide deformylase [Patescibacteria group bacterium]
MKKKIYLASDSTDIKTLRAKSERVEKVDEKIRQLIADMFESMHGGEENGIGLSAPQVGELKRIIIAEYSSKETPVPRTAIINPEIIWSSKKLAEDEEGCLSFPQIYGMVKRPESIRYKGLDENGNPIERKAGGLLARVIQHEIDHLNGVLLPDRVEGDLYTYEKTDDANKL